MRRVFIVAFPVLFLVASGALSTTAASGQVDPIALRQGLIYDGLQRVAQSDICQGNYRLLVQYRGMPVCTHGPDPAPPVSAALALNTSSTRAAHCCMDGSHEA